MTIRTAIEQASGAKMKPSFACWLRVHTPEFAKQVSERASQHQWHSKLVVFQNSMLHPGGNSKSVRLVQFRKVLLPIVCRPFCSFTDSSWVQSQKANDPMVTRLEGSSILVSLVHPKKALLPIVSNCGAVLLLLQNTTLSSWVQFENASS